MIKIALIALFLLTPIFTEELVISWTESKKLSWDDFKATTPSDSNAVALTASGMTFSFSVRELNDKFVSFNAKVEAHFYPNKSWIINERANDFILAHEQLHFDITELHVRKLRQQIAMLKVSQDIKENLRNLHQHSNEELAIMQNQYDAQTDHSRNIEKQLDWHKFIHFELNILKSFSSK